MKATKLIENRRKIVVQYRNLEQRRVTINKKLRVLRGEMYEIDNIIINEKLGVFR